MKYVLPAVEFAGMYPPVRSASMKLDRTWLKVERAIQHLEDLQKRVALIKDGVFSVTEQRDPSTNDRVWVMEATDRSRFLLGISIYGDIVGDVVHQLPSSLHHPVVNL